MALNDERSSSYLLISLLRILSNIHSNSSDQKKDQDLLSHLLTNLTSLAGTINGRNLCGLLNRSQDLQDAGVSVRTQGQDPSRPTGHCVTILASGMTQKRVFIDVDHGSILRSPPVTQANILSPTKHSIPTKVNDLDPTVGRKKLHNIDLNNVNDDSEECMENLETSDAPVNVATGSPDCPLWIHEDSHKSSSPQASENSGSTTTKSPSSSNIEAQDCSWFDSIPSIDKKWSGIQFQALVMVHK